VKTSNLTIFMNTLIGYVPEMEVNIRIVAPALRI
jgi:hypothetical protein